MALLLGLLLQLHRREALSARKLPQDHLGLDGRLMTDLLANVIIGAGATLIIVCCIIVMVAFSRD